MHRALNYIGNLAHAAIQYRLAAVDMYRDIHTTLKADFPIPAHHNERPNTLSSIEDIAGAYTRIKTPNDLDHFSDRLELTLQDSSLMCTTFGPGSRSKGRELLVPESTLGHVHPHHDLRYFSSLATKSVNPSSNGGTTRWMSFTSALSETATTSSRDESEFGFSQECIFAP